VGLAAQVAHGFEPVDERGRRRGADAEPLGELRGPERPAVEQVVERSEVVGPEVQRAGHREGNLLGRPRVRGHRPPRHDQPLVGDGARAADHRAGLIDR